ncbi:MAG TPA: GntR family transcriptional regulator [Steroidobacteraceae bacterium]|jgi:GntR family transcriptional regulator|nr:GntR family transcriptional regulator [Steroidobacteraceae bacterium]
MEINIVTSSPEPVYEQIVRQVQHGVAEGELKPGDALPTVRQLADDLQINRNTVARAYKLLEDRGVLVTAGRRGTFVRNEAAHEVHRAKSGQAERAMRQTVSMLLGEGMTRAQVAALFKNVLAGVKS